MPRIDSVSPLLDRLSHALCRPVYYWKSPDRYASHLRRDAERWTRANADLGEPLTEGGVILAKGC